MRCVIFILICLSAAIPCSARIITVDDDGPADFNNIQAAIDAAVEGDTVIVAEGRYVENINFNGRNITLTSTDPCNPGVVASTIIDGNQNGSVITFNSGEDENCVLNGFTIINGNAEYGGGIYCGWPPGPPPPRPPGTVGSQSSPEARSEYDLPDHTINNCTITGNTASKHGGGIYCEYSNPTLTNCTVSCNSAFEGGGMFNFSSNLTIANCIFSGNSAQSGGGMYNREGSPTLTTCTFSENSAHLSGGGIQNEYYCSSRLINCTFSGNSAIDYGGGMENLFHSNPILTNCTFNGNSADSGGGLSNNFHSSPMLTDCTFSENSAICGGGMYNWGYSSPTLVNCTFSGNSAINYDGGGMFNHESSPTLANCIFNENSADFGGGMCNFEASPTLTNCTFSGNSAIDYGGGGMFNFEASPTLTNCTFSENTAGWGGGGMCNHESSPTLTNCTFRGNWAHRSGGGIHNEHYSSPTLVKCTFSKNSADSGGGMCNDGSFRESNPTLTNCTFSGNSAIDYGGGMYNYKSSPEVTNCLFSGNLARQRGGGMYNRNISRPTLTNCTFSGNSADYFGGMYNGQGSYTMVINCIFWDNGSHGVTAAVDATYSNIEGGWPGEGNIDANPCFVAPGHFEPNCVSGPDYPYCTYNWIGGDYHLLPDSPCINAGDPNYVAEPNETDLDGRPRVISGRIDMGAYESILPAEVRIVPRTINMANQQKWITCYIYLPEEYNIADIDLCVVLLEHEIESEQFSFNEKKQIVVARFSHEQLQKILDIGEVELTINVHLTYTTYFEGTDVIRVIHEGGGKLAELGEASNLNPADGATGVIIDADLSWIAGSYATSHDVYFGTSSPPPFIGNQTATTFDPGTMDYETTYYWRIDEINKWNKTAGQIWSFTTHGPPPPGPPPPPPPP